MMPALTAPRDTIAAHPAGDVSIVDVATGAVERRISLGGHDADGESHRARALSRLHGRAAGRRAGAAVAARRCRRRRRGSARRRCHGHGVRSPGRDDPARDSRRERALPDRRSPARPLPSGRGWRRRGDVTGAADDRRRPLVQRDAAHAARVPRRRGRRRRPPRGVDRDAHLARRRIDRPDARPHRIAAAAGRRRHAARLGHRGQRPAAQPRRRRRLPLRRRRRAGLRAPRSDVGPGAGLRRRSTRSPS